MGEKSWPKLLILASRKPLAAVLWIYGVYFSLGVLFDAMDPAVRIASLGPKLTTLTYLGLTIASFWLIFRCIKGAQKKMQIRADRSPGILDKVLVPVTGTALRLLVPALGLIILAGAADLPEPYTGWNSKCEIREGLVKFIQTQHPESLPKVRAKLRRDAGKTDPMEMPATPQPTPVEKCASSPGLMKSGKEGDVR